MRGCLILVLAIAVALDDPRPEGSEARVVFALQ